MSKTVLFQTIQFSISTQFSSIWTKGICAKANIIAWLEFEVTNFKTEVHHFSYCNMGTLWIKLVTIVKGDLKAPFSIPTSQRCRKRRYSIPWIAPLYSWSLLYDVKQGGIKYYFLSLWDPWQTLLFQLSQYHHINYDVFIWHLLWYLSWCLHIY